jgi:hypothetical protein
MSATNASPTAPPAEIAAYLCTVDNLFNFSASVAALIKLGLVKFA